MEDINKVVLVGRLTRDAEQSYTQSGYSLLKFSLASNRRRKQGDQWVDEANFFDVTLWGKRGEAIASFMTKGKQVAVEGQLRQERWESQDGSKRSKVTIDANNIQFLGSREGGSQSGGYRGDNEWDSPKKPSAPRQSAPPPNSFEDDIPF